MLSESFSIIIDFIYTLFQKESLYRCFSNRYVLETAVPVCDEGCITYLVETSIFLNFGTFMDSF